MEKLSIKNEDWDYAAGVVLEVSVDVSSDSDMTGGNPLLTSYGENYKLM